MKYHFFLKNKPKKNKLDNAFTFSLYFCIINMNNLIATKKDIMYICYSDVTYFRYKWWDTC